MSDIKIRPDQVAMIVASLVPNDIMSVYSGKDGCCCCGCSGTHYYPPGAVGAAAWGGNISSAMVTKVFNLLRRATYGTGHGLSPVEVNETYLSTTTSTGRVYVAYLTEQGQRLVREVVT